MGVIERVNSRSIFRVAAALSTAVVLAASVWWFGPAARGASTGFVLSANQQAQRLFDEGRTAEAAARFEDARWQGAAWYRARNFKQAAASLTGFDDAESMYNHGNALVMLGQYDAAVERFESALSLRPDWIEAKENRDLAKGRAERLRREGGNMTEGKLGADEIRFDEGGVNDSAQDVQVSAEQNDATFREVWLRRVNTKPADFLKSKFAYQAATAATATDAIGSEQ